MGSAFWKKHRGDCESVEPRLEEYISGAMPDGEENARIATHLAVCDHCRLQAAAYQRAGQAWTAFSSLPTPEQPGDWSAVRARLQSPTAQRMSRPALPFFGGRALLGMALAVTAGACAVLYPPPEQKAMLGNADIVAQTAPPQQNGTAEFAPKSVTQAALEEQSGLKVYGITPAFENFNTTEVNPIVIAVANRGDAVDAEATVLPYNTNGARIYHKKFRIPNGKSRLMLYPSAGPNVSAGNLPSFRVTLTAPHFEQSIGVHNPSGGMSYRGAVYIGERLGALAPNYTKFTPQKRQKMALSPLWRNTDWNNQAAYGRPENAPDEAIGYNGVGMVVVSPDAAGMTSAQWQALREWTQIGGQLILIGGGAEELLNIPQVAEMAPVMWSGQAFQKFDLKPNSLVDKNIITQEAGNPAPGIDRSAATVTRRPLGLGVVYYTNFDPTAEPLREWAGYGTMWQNIRAHRGAVDGGMLREAGRQRAPWDHQANVLSSDPFKLALPSLPNVVYMFLIYFVLVVPVTFVVLKHTRRMNLAWVTGPSLAVLFSAGLFLLTVRLYLAPNSRRTSGVLALAQGENAGTLTGYTEMFFARAGSYRIEVPGAVALETETLVGNQARSLETQEDESGRLIVPDLGVGNLSFRRFYQEQNIMLSGGITANLRLDNGGNLVGTVQNNTGKTLFDAAVRWSKSVPRKDKAYQYRLIPVNYKLGDLKPGRMVIEAKNSGETMSYLSWQYQEPGTGNDSPVDIPLRKPTLLARIGGAEFGPQMGKDFSGDRSVTVVVGLDGEQIGGVK